MNMAVFFQKHDRKALVGLWRMLYWRFCLRSPRKVVRYLRDAGAVIGEGTTVLTPGVLGTEPWLVEIGCRTYVSGEDTRILTHDGGISKCYDMGLAPKKMDCFGKVKIGSNCFIGARCIIMKNVTIGDNCVIGAGSVVTKDIPNGSVACGVPAKVVGTTKEYYEKNKEHLDDTIGWNTYKKRLYLEEKYGKHS